MTALDLDAVRERYEHAMRASKNTLAVAASFSAEDVPKLLAEIERLRAWNKDVIAQTDIEIGQLNAAIRLATARANALEDDLGDARRTIRALTGGAS